MAAQMEARAVLSAEDRASAVLAMVSRNFDKLSRAADQINRVPARAEAMNAHLERRAAIMQRVSSIAATAAAGSLLASPAVAAAAVLKATKAYAEQERAMTRIAITGDATRAQQEQAALTVERVADKTGVAAADVRSSMDVMVASGRSWAEATDSLPAIAKVTQATGAEAKDIATTTASMMDQFGITADGMNRAYDILAKGGKLGQFELKDQARYLPELLPAAKALGMAGEDGLAKIAAMLQTVRSGTGSAEEAASSIKNIFAKMTSDKTVKNFKDVGIDLRKELEAAKASGKDTLETFVQLSNKAMKGDLSKIPDFFEDQEFARGMRAWVGGMEKYSRFKSEMKDSAGTIDTDFNRAMKDQQTSWDRLSNSAGRFVRTIGGLAPVAGAMDAVTDKINKMSEALTRQDEARRALDAAGLKPIAKTVTAPTAQADAVIARAKRENDPQYWGDMLAMDEDEASRRGRRGGKPKPSKAGNIKSVEDAYNDQQRARAEHLRETEIAQQSQRIAEKAAEAADIKAGSGPYQAGQDAAAHSIAAQRARGGTVRTLGFDEATAKGDVQEAAQRLGSALARAGGKADPAAPDFKASISQLTGAIIKMEDARRGMEGNPIKASSEEISQIVTAAVAAVQADPKAYRDGKKTDVPTAAPAPVAPDHVPPRPQVIGGVAYSQGPPPAPPPANTPEKLVATVQPDQITARIEPGQITAKVDPAVSSSAPARPQVIGGVAYSQGPPPAPQPANTPEKLVATVQPDQITARVEPDQVTAKLEGRVDTQVNVTVTPSDNFIITVTNRVKQAIGPLNASATTGQANP